MSAARCYPCTAGHAGRCQGTPANPCPCPCNSDEVPEVASQEYDETFQEEIETYRRIHGDDGYIFLAEQLIRDGQAR